MRRTFSRPLRLSRGQFEQLVETTLAALPSWVQEQLARVTIVVEDEPEPGEDPETLGLCIGPSLLDDPTYSEPPQIVIYRRPHLRYCRTLSQLQREVTETVLHEVAHHFGFNEAQIAALGRLRLSE